MPNVGGGGGKALMSKFSRCENHDEIDFRTNLDLVFKGEVRYELKSAEKRCGVAKWTSGT